MTRRHVFHAMAAIALLVLSLAPAATAAVTAHHAGNPTLASWFGPNPIGGTEQATVETALVNYLKSVGISESAAVIWTNASTKSSLFGEIAAMPVHVTGRMLATNVRSACAVEGGKLGSLTKVATLPHGIQLSCAVTAHGRTVRINWLGGAKANVMMINGAIFGRHFSLRALDAFSIREYRRVPASGMAVPAGAS